MKIDLSGNFFQVFNVPPVFDVDEQELLARYRELQRQLHPDRFMSGTDAERRWSLQAASLVNQAYQTLRNDLRRACYLLQLNGIEVDEETDTQMEPGFLMEQMELREGLEMAESADDPQKMLADIRKQLREMIGEHKQSFGRAVAETDWVAARTVVRQWQFLDKLLSESRLLEERLDA